MLSTSFLNQNKYNYMKNKNKNKKNVLNKLIRFILDLFKVSICVSR